MTPHSEPDWDFIQIRIRADRLEEELLESVDLLYGILVLTLSSNLAEFNSTFTSSVRFKFLQFPQGFRVGRRLIELDDQAGGLLEVRGIPLRQLVYAPRNK
jgi:hypothetical protein